MRSWHPWLHFRTITRHKLLVMKYCFRIGLYKQGLLHDLSKYSPTEFLVGCKYYQGTRSPNNAEREATGVSRSWLHHKEMVMDRISASRNYLGEEYTYHEPLQYFLKSKEKLWFIHPQTKKELEGLLRILDKYGEDKTLWYIRNVYLCDNRGKRVKSPRKKLRNHR